MNAQKTDGNDNWLLIGRIVGAHGLNGHVKVYPESDFPERFITPGERWLKKAHGQPTAVRLTSGRYLEGKNNYLVKLEGIDYRDQAEDLRGAQLIVPDTDRLPLEPGEFHVDDLIGLEVILQAEQRVLGVVSNLFTTGHDLLEVTLVNEPSADESTVLEAAPNESPTAGAEKTAEKQLQGVSVRTKAAAKLRKKAKREKKKKKPKTLLIPFVEDIVPVVDVGAGRIEITPPAGLIDLA